jgi:hypothetical protein
MDAEGYTKMILDKTLADYIKRAQEELKKDTTPTPQKEEQYQVLPEDNGYDIPRNPFGNH